MVTPRTRAFCLALTLAAGFAGSATAADWYTGAVPDRGGGSNDWIVAVDSSLSTTSTGSIFGAVAGTIAPVDTLGESGARVRIEGIGGHYSYRLSNVGTDRKVEGTQAEGTLLAGYEWQGLNSALSAYIGVAARNNEISVRDVSNPVVGTKIGFKSALEGYIEPVPGMMIAASGSYNTAFSAYYGRVKVGFDVGNRIFVGPEFTALGDDFYNQWRVGAHVTGFRVGAFQLSAAAGFLHDRHDGNGAYTTIDARTGF